MKPIKSEHDNLWGNNMSSQVCRTKVVEEGGNKCLGELANNPLLFFCLIFWLLYFNPHQIVLINCFGSHCCEVHSNGLEEKCTKQFHHCFVLLVWYRTCISIGNTLGLIILCWCGENKWLLILWWLLRDAPLSTTPAQSREQCCCLCSMEENLTLFQ